LFEFCGAWSGEEREAASFRANSETGRNNETVPKQRKSVLLVIKLS
jgi:hypothetical protein